MSFSNSQGSGANMTGSVDIVANSISIINSDGTLSAFTGSGGGGGGGGSVANTNNPIFTGTVTVSNLVGATKSMIGLSNVANTAPSDLPISLATQAALSLFNNVANTSPSGLPVSTATQTALNLLAPKASPTLTGTVGV